MKYLLDTDHLSVLTHRSGADYAILSLQIDNQTAGDVCVSVVSIQEQILGANALIANFRQPKHLLRGYEIVHILAETYRRFTVVPFDAAALTEFDRLKAMKLRVGTMDLRIAATGLSRGLTVVTRNDRDFAQVPGLKIEDWTR